MKGINDWKCYKIIIHTQFIMCVEENNLFTDNQCGHRSGCSTNFKVHKDDFGVI